ncbi:MAG: hypothetical protein J0H18_11075 [Rhizobiales bacterium]|nr:hypothetical protein [Hyphomicrobiales bacterium]
MRSRSARRLHLAHELQTAHGIDTADMAELCGLSLESYRSRLRRLQLEEPPAARTRKREAEPALVRLQAELNALLAAEELPDKGRAEALMALARAVKTVGELSTEADAAPARNVANAACPVSVAEVRQALRRINRRIDDLAEKRAQEILGGRADAGAVDSGRGGMASQGA